MVAGVHVRLFSKGALGFGAGDGKEQAAEDAVFLDMFPQNFQAFLQFARQARVFRGGVAQGGKAPAFNGDVDEVAARAAAEIKQAVAQEFRVIASISGKGEAGGG